MFEVEFSLVTVHVAILFLTIAVILYADKQGFSWILGKDETLNKTKLEILHRLMWGGLIGMIATGVFLFWPLREFLLTQPVYYIKMFFVSVLAINAFFIGKFMNVATERQFSDLSKSERVPLFVSGAVSTVAWAGAIIGGLLLGV